MRRSTPAIGVATQGCLAACTTARRVKSELISIRPSRSSRLDAGTVRNPRPPGHEMGQVRRNIDLGEVGEDETGKGGDVGHREAVAGKKGTIGQYAVEI